MKSITLAATGVLILLTEWPAAAEDTKDVVNASMTVYAHIVKIESLIDACRRIDAAEVIPYDKVYQEYQDEIGGTVASIGYLVGQASRRAGINKQSLLKAFDALVDNTAQTVYQAARTDQGGSVRKCRTLPKAIAEKTKPFEPLAMRFPYEMKTIQDSFY